MFKKLSSVFIGLTFGNIVALLVFFSLMSFIGCLHGDTGSHTISGSPSLDSKTMGYWLHWMHAAGYYFIPIELLTIGLAVCFTVLAKME